MSKEVKRYCLSEFAEPHTHPIGPGAHVLASDYDALLADRDRIRREGENIRLQWKEYATELVAERDSLKQLLAETRTSMIEAIHWEDLTPVRKRIETALQGEQP